jgi:hypothetical protein
MPLLLAGESEEGLPFQPGDRFEYSMHWSFIKVGKAELSFQRATIDGDDSEYLHAVFVARTVGVAETLFKVRDRIEVWVHPETGRPKLYKKRQREGKTKRDIEVHFDWDKSEATYIRDGKANDPIKVTEETYDPLSLIIAIAGRNYTVGQTETLQTTDGKRALGIEVLPTKEKKLKTGAGKFNAIAMDVATKELEGVFEKSPDASIELWLKKGSPAIPLKLKSEVIVGSFYGKLEKGTVAGKPIGKR